MDIEQALMIADVAETFTRKIVELESQQRQWVGTVARIREERDAALERAKAAEATVERLSNKGLDMTAELLAADRERDALKAKVAELEAQNARLADAMRAVLGSKLPDDPAAWGPFIRQVIDEMGETASRRIALLRRGCAVEYGPLLPLAEEMARARAKFPEQHRLLAALMEEVGETAQAYLEGKPAHAREEALQVACVAMRIYEHGDWDYEPPKAVDDTPETCPHPAGTQTWARWMAIYKGVCVQRLHGAIFSWDREHSFRYWACEAWHPCGEGTAISSPGHSLDWFIVPNPETGA